VGVPIRKKKQGNDNSILLVNFGLPELCLHMIGNKQRIDDYDVRGLGHKEGWTHGS